MYELNTPFMVASDFSSQICQSSHMWTVNRQSELERSNEIVSFDNKLQKTDGTRYQVPYVLVGNNTLLLCMTVL